MDTPDSKPPFEPPQENRQEDLAPGEPAPAGLGPDLFAPPPAPVDPLARYPEDQRTPWGWLDVLILAFFGLGSLLIVSQVAASMVALVFRISPGEFDQVPNAKAAFAVLSQVMASGVVMVYLWAVARMRFGMTFGRALVWRAFELPGTSRAKTWGLFLLGGAVLAIFVSIASGLLKPEAPLPIEEMFRSRQSVYMLMVAGIVVAPLVEETLFRGFLYPVLARSWGVGAGIVVTGMLFGLMHASQLWGGWGQIALLTLVGILFTYARARTGTVLAPFLLHLGYNTLLFAAFFVGTGGLRDLPGN